MRPYLLLFTLAMLAILSGCDERSSPGIIYTEDGQFLANNDRNAKLTCEQAIDRSINRELGAHWRCQTSIAELPARRGGGDDGEWRWTDMTVSTEVIGDGSAPLPIPVAEIERAIDQYCRGKITRGGHVNLTVKPVTDAARLADAGKTAVMKPEAKNETANKADRYTIQNGDTLAAISTAFYGSNQHWRLIADANPGLDASHLAPGTVIVIPALPSAR
jgi:LysM repeat protein